MNIPNQIKRIFTLLLIIGIAFSPNISLAASVEVESQLASISQTLLSLRRVLSSFIDSLDDPFAALPRQDSLAAVSPLACTAGTRVDYSVQNNPRGIVFDNVTNSVWVANLGSETLSKVNIDTGGKVDYSIGNPAYVGANTFTEIAFDNVTNSVWAINTGTPKVAIKVNIQNGTPTHYSVGGTLLLGGVFDGTTRSLWTFNNGTPGLIKINNQTGAKTAYNVSMIPRLFENVTNSLWGMGAGSVTLKKVNPSTGALLGQYNIGGTVFDGIGVEALAFDTVTNSIWIPKGGYNSSLGAYNNKITKFNIATGAVADYTVGNDPHGVAFDGVNSVWVANYKSNTVSKINVQDGSRVDYPAGTNPDRVVFDSATNSIWITNYTENVESISPGTVSKFCVGDSAAPSTPGTPTASGITQTSATIAWSASTDTGGSSLSGYKLFRNGTQIATTTTPSYTDGALSASNTYSYTVSAYDGANNTSALSAPKSVTTLSPTVTLDTTAPTTPGTPTASNITQTGATLSWTVSTDAVGVTGYKVYKDGAEIATGITATTYNVTGLTARSAYAFAIAAYDARTNTSAKSTSVNVSTLTPPVVPVVPVTPPTTTPPPITTTPPAPVPQYPEKVTSISITSITDSSISFSWRAASGDTSRYEIRRDGNSLENTTTLNFVDSDLQSSRSHEYSICSESSYGLKTCTSNFVVTTREAPVSSSVPSGTPSNESITTPIAVGVRSVSSSQLPPVTVVPESQEVWPAAPGKFVFYPGVHANEVYELQRSLIKGGYLAETSVSGYEGWYGNKTKNAVANFQLQNGIITDTNSSVLGIVGPTTLNRLNSILGAGIYSVTKGVVDATPAGVSNTPVPASSIGSASSSGFSGTEIWPKTKDSRFLLYRGVYAEEALKLQQCLISGGYLPSVAIVGGEGWYGRKTAGAVGQFQVENGILSSSASLAYGVVGPTTLSRLNSILNCEITITR